MLSGFPFVATESNKKNSLRTTGLKKKTLADLRVGNFL
jgi:hypothetical protein